MHYAIYRMQCSHIIISLNTAISIRPCAWQSSLPASLEFFDQNFVNEEYLFINWNKLRDRPCVKFAFMTSVCNSSQLTLFCLFSSFPS